MKKLFIIFMVLLVGVFFSISVNAEPSKKDEKKKEVVQQCPKTKMTENCLYCHQVPTFKLKESAPDVNMEYPNSHTKIIDGKGYYYLDDISDGNVREFFNYLAWHPLIKYVIIEIQSPGGSMFNAWRIVGLMDLYKKRGYTIETRCHGFAASAGFMVFINGTKGYRFATPTSELMWHELITFKLFDISSPADKEDEANVLRHFQDNANNWLASRSKLKKEEWDKKIYKKEFWMTGKQAVEFGVADGVPK